MTKWREFWQRHLSILPILLALLAVIIYAIQSIYFILHQLPIMDEGAYLFKGYQFAQGNYVPFQSYGLWTNKMYLAFYIWGWIQQLFQPGLLAPRLFTLIFGLLTLLGTWLIIRRLANLWLAAGALLVIALNPQLVSIYSLAISQVLVVCILTWILVLILGSDRPTWMIILGSFLAGAMIFIRENMIFMIPLIAIYLFWQQGKKKGFIALGMMLLVLFIGHIFFWPNILYIWDRWIPNLLRIFSTSQSAASQTTTSSGMDLKSLLARIHSVATALSVFIIPLLGSFLVLLFWPKKNNWQSKEHQKIILFLIVAYAILLASHLYASIGNDYCVYCTTNYFSFFGNLGLILVALSFNSLNWSPNRLQKWILGIFIPICTGLIGFSLFEQVGIALNNILVPRFRGGKILSGSTKLWQLLSNKYGIELETSRRVLPIIFGFLIGILIVMIIFSLARYLSKKKTPNYFFSPFVVLLLIFLAASPFVNAVPSQIICKTNVPAFYTSMAEEMNSKIPAGSIVYLDGNLPPIPLLNLNNVKIFPPQINGYNSFDDKTIDPLKIGKWNISLQTQWKKEANIFIIGAERIKFWRDDLYKYKLLYDSSSSQPGACPNTAAIYFYQQIK